MRIIFRTDAAHSQPCICDDYDGQIYEHDTPDLPFIPVHPHCACRWFDADTGEDLGTDLFIISQLSEKPLDQSDIEKLKRLQYK